MKKLEELSREYLQDAAFRDYISLCEEVCRHDLGHSNERLVLEYLEREFSVPSNRQEW